MSGRRNQRRSDEERSDREPPGPAPADEIIELLHSEALRHTWHPTLSVVAPGGPPDPSAGSEELLWCYRTATGLDVRKVEVRADRQSKTGNFYFELVHDEASGKEGWFLSSPADYLFYFFPRAGFVYVLPLPAVRSWVERCEDQFKLKRTKIKAQNGVRFMAGRLVPAARLVREVEDVRCFARVRGRWIALSYDE